MKIGLVLSATPSYSETFFNSKIKGLQESGHTIVLYTQNINPDFNLCEVKKVFPVQPNNLLKQLFWGVMVGFKLLRHLKVTLKFIQVERKDQLPVKRILKHLYSSAHLLSERMDWLHFGFATLALGKENVAKSIGAKMAVSIRGFDIAIYPVKHPHCYDLLWTKIDKLHTISDDLLALAYKNGLPKDCKVEKITPAVDSHKFSVDRNTEIKAPRISILTIARLHWKKGLMDTLQALKILKDFNIDFSYTLVGEGEQFEALTYLVHHLNLTKEVQLVGKKTPAEIKKLLATHEVYIQYSKSEGFCNAVLEAQAAGLLCIVSDAEGLPENVKHEESGWIIPKGNPKELAIKIIEVSNLPISAKQKVRNYAINRVQNEFDLSNQQKLFLNFYKTSDAI